METLLSFAILSAALVAMMFLVTHAVLCVVNDLNTWRDRRRWMKEWRSLPSTMRALNPPKHIQASLMSDTWAKLKAPRQTGHSGGGASRCSL